MTQFSILHVALLALTVTVASRSFCLVEALSSSFSAIGSSPPVHTLLLCRHGDSVWNGGQPGCDERFTGWTDVQLSDNGRQEATEAASQLAGYFYNVDMVFTSMLQRALETTEACLDHIHRDLEDNADPPPVICDFRLAERHYGSLQGYVKKEVESGKYGHDRDLVEQWRRSWYAVPPLLDDNDERRKEEVSMFGELCGGAEHVPRGESLEMVAKNRVRPCLNEVITPALNLIAAQKSDKSHKRAEEELTAGLVVAHANSLRALIGVLCEVEDDPLALGILESLRIPTGVPLVIHYQQLADGRYRACPLPEPEECLIQDDYGYFNKPKEAPPNLGHPNLPVWPLNKCIPLEEKSRQDFFASFANTAQDTYALRTR